MNLKIVNKGKFMRSILLIFLLIIGISFMISSKSFSHIESKYKTIYVTSGDTLWSIAKEEKNSNEYYKDKNIQNIVDEIKKVNHMSNSDLKINQELKIKEL
ncbi:MAG: LysM peptidoglycan-binding domain-containing protein [Clostridia bacterium]|nr:LysM peptidoglycan-binding domain-containing protein [Clostridia bacterium]